MNIKNYRFADQANKSVQVLGLIRPLVQADSPFGQQLPNDTRFALVIEAIDKDFNQSFVEMDVNINPMTDREDISGEGFVGRFLGYLTFTENKMRIYKVLDLDSTQCQDQQANVVSQNQTIQLFYETDIAKLSSQLDWGTYVLTDGTKKFKLVNVWPISRAEGRFESKSGGFQAGLKPLYAYINSHGGNIKFAKSFNIWAVVIIIIAVALTIFIMTLK